MENKVEPAENNGKCDNGDDAVYDDNSAYYFEIVIYKTIIITAISLYHMNPIFFLYFWNILSPKAIMALWQKPW